MDTINKITHSIIASQITLFHLESIKHTPYYKQSLKQKLNLVLAELIRHEKYYDEFFNSVEEQTLVTYEMYDNYVKAIASVPIWDCGNITEMIKAYNKDKKSLAGLVNKINRK